jgi:hypothetical protein
MKKHFLLENVFFLYNILRKVKRELIKNIHKSSCQRAVFLFRFTLNLNVSDMFEKYSITKFREIPSMGTDGQTDMTTLIIAFRNLAHLTRSHFMSIFSQTRKASITQVGNFVETLPLAVALNQADGKQRNKTFVVCFEYRITEAELNRAEKLFKREHYIAIAQILVLYYYYYYYYIFTFMHVMYNYIPETTPVYIVQYSTQCCSCSVFTVCVTRNVISPMKYVLPLYIITSCSLCAVSNMAAFCNSSIPFFPAMLLRYCLGAFETVPVALLLSV